MKVSEKDLIAIPVWQVIHPGMKGTVPLEDASGLDGKDFLLTREYTGEDNECRNKFWAKIDGGDEQLVCFPVVVGREWLNKAFPLYA